MQELLQNAMQLPQNKRYTLAALAISITGLAATTLGIIASPRTKQTGQTTEVTLDCPLNQVVIANGETNLNNTWSCLLTNNYGHDVGIFMLPNLTITSIDCFDTDIFSTGAACFPFHTCPLDYPSIANGFSCSFAFCNFQTIRNATSGCTAIATIPSLTLYDNANTFYATPSNTIVTLTYQPLIPTVSPSPAPTPSPTRTPTQTPTLAPTPSPTRTPTQTPTLFPTLSPTRTPTQAPTLAPTLSPTRTPTQTPTLAPTPSPTRTPTQTPTLAPTPSPTRTPTQTPTLFPTPSPTRTPTQTPTLFPTRHPTHRPTPKPGPHNTAHIQNPPECTAGIKLKDKVILSYTIINDASSPQVIGSWQCKTDNSQVSTCQISTADEQKETDVTTKEVTNITKCKTGLRLDPETSCTFSVVALKTTHVDFENPTDLIEQSNLETTLTTSVELGTRRQLISSDPCRVTQLKYNDAIAIENEVAIARHLRSDKTTDSSTKSLSHKNSLFFLSKIDKKDQSEEERYISSLRQRV